MRFVSQSSLAESWASGHAAGAEFFWREAQLTEIKNRKELEAWLRGKPREVSVALAARAALRVVPVMHMAERAEDYASDLVLPVFRAAAVAWAAAEYPAHERELTTACRAAVGFNAALSASPKWVFAAAAAASRAAEDAAIVMVRDTTAADAAASAAAAAEAYAAAAIATATAFGVAASAAFWAAVSSDATRVEEGIAASVIAGSPLWPDSHPDGLQSLWQEMKAALLATGQDWDVWTTWYDDRLDGRVGEEERELAYVRIDDRLWDQGPAIVNAEIKRRIALHEPPPFGWQSSFDQPSRQRFPAATIHDGRSSFTDFAQPPFALIHEPPPIEAIPEQAPAATRFGINSQGLIDVVPDPPVLEPLTDALQRELYDESRGKAQVLLELGPNLLGELSGPAIRFRESLPEQIEDVSVSRSWSRGNTLRSRLKAHDLSMSSAEPDPARLPHLVAETLRDLTGTWNVFIIGDPKGRELDEIRLGPQEVEAAKQVIAAAAPIVAAIERSENVATPLAVEAVTEQAQAAKNAPTGIDGNHAIDLSRKTTGNFVAEALRRAYSLFRVEAASAWREYRAGVYRAAGTATFAGGAAGAIVYWPEIVSFVVKNADALKAFVTAAWHNPTLVEIIDWIVRTLT